MASTRTTPGLGARIAASGFTLIELMITVAIVALLAAIAIPSYQDSVWKGKRAEAKAAIFKALQAEERFYTQNNTYACYPLCAAAPSGAFPVFSADNAANSRYTIDVAATGSGLCAPGGAAVNDISKCAVVTASVVSNADPTCGTKLAMDTVGNKASDIANAACWK